MRISKLDVEFINLLDVVKSVIEYGIKYGRSQELIEFLKQQHLLLSTTKVNVVEYSWSKLTGTVGKICHPDVVGDSPEQAEGEKLLTAYNSANVEIKNGLKELKKNNIEEYYCPLPSTYTDQRSQSSQGYTQHQRNSSSSSRPGYNPESSRQSTNHYNAQHQKRQQSNYQQHSSYGQSYQQRSTNQQDRHSSEYEYGFDPDTQGDWQEGYGVQNPVSEFFKTIKGMWDLHVNKIPSTYEEFDKISKFYKKKIERAGQELRTQKAKVDELIAERDDNNREWNRERTVRNIEEEYRKECVRLSQEVEKARVQYQVQNNQLNQRWSELQGEINQRIAEYNMQYRYYLSVYNEITALIQNGTIDVNRPYMNTKKTHMQMLNEAIEFLNSHQNHFDVTKGIENDVLRGDKKYCTIEQKWIKAHDEWRKCSNEYDDWYQHAKAKKDGIFARINAYYSNIEVGLNGKIDRAIASYNAIQQQLEEFKRRYEEFMKTYQELDLDAHKKRK